MDYKGKKVWFFRVIPLVYSSNQSEWAVDIQHPTLNEIADSIVTKALKLCAFLHIPVMISARKDRELVKNQPASNKLPRRQIPEF